MDDVGKRRRANRFSCVETGHDAGLEVARKWAKADDKYRAWPRIAKAVEEARREIDVQTLRYLIDPEHRMGAGDWVRFWKIGASAAIANRAMSATEPSPMLQLGASRKSEPNCNSKPVPWDKAPQVGL